MKTWKADPLNNTRLVLGEGAIWSSLRNLFFYVDIEGQKVGLVDPVSGMTKQRQLAEKVGTVVPTEDGRLILGLENSISLFDFDSDELLELIKIEPEIPTNRCNDGKCDPAGRLWIGTMDKEAKGAVGALYCFDGKEVKKMIPNRKVSNGICWSADNSQMYYIDSLDYNIKGYDFDVETGSVSNERIVVEMKESGFTPDGMTIDEQGMLWVAMWGEGTVNRYNPLSGELVGIVKVNAPHVSSCAFGGATMTQLLITTARAELSDEQLKQFPESGSLFLVDVGIKGTQMNPFKI
jgi:sugar lactone lactonase YvrE